MLSNIMYNMVKTNQTNYDVYHNFQDQKLLLEK